MLRWRDSVHGAVPKSGKSAVQGALQAAVQSQQFLGWFRDWEGLAPTLGTCVSKIGKHWCGNRQFLLGARGSKIGKTLATTFGNCYFIELGTRASKIGKYWSKRLW